MPRTPVRWRIVASGTVQLVNYRERVQRAALAHHLVGEVENDREDDERVVIDAQGSAADLLQFLEAIRGAEGRSDAREVLKVKELQADPNLTQFQIKRGKAREETLERVEFTRHTMTDLLGDVESLRAELKEGLRALGESHTALARSLTSAASAGGERDRATHEAVRALAVACDQGLGALSKRLEQLAESLTEQADAQQRRLQDLETATLAIAKSVARIEETLEQEVEEQEQRARSVEQQRSALLQLAQELSRPGGEGPRRRKVAR